MLKTISYSTDGFPFMYEFERLDRTNCIDIPSHQVAFIEQSMKNANRAQEILESFFYKQEDGFKGGDTMACGKKKKGKKR